MGDDDLSGQIALSEAEIETISKTLDRCRKVMLVSRLIIVAGVVLILALAIGAITFDGTAMIGSIAAIIGGVVIFGSNSSTSKQAAAAMKAAEKHRAELTEMIDLRTVGPM